MAAGHGGARRPTGDRPRARGRRASWSGAALGAVVTVLGRRAEDEARTGLVDWRAVARLADDRLRRAPGALGAAEIAATEPAYAAAMARVVPALEAALGVPLPGIVDRVAVVDRAAWVEANLVTFADLIGEARERPPRPARPARRRPRQGVDGAGQPLGHHAAARLPARIPWPARPRPVRPRAPLRGGAAGTAPLRRGEHPRHAAALHVDVAPFRTWIALHETTHAFEFEAHPWLRPYLADRLDQQLPSVLAEHRLARPRRDASARARPARWRHGHWMERLMSDEQRALFRETQAVMSLLEGFGDHVMDEVGQDLVPGVEHDLGTVPCPAQRHGRRWSGRSCGSPGWT